MCVHFVTFTVFTSLNGSHECGGFWHWRDHTRWTKVKTKENSTFSPTASLLQCLTSVGDEPRLDVSNTRYPFVGVCVCVCVCVNVPPGHHRGCESELEMKMCTVNKSLRSVLHFLPPSKNGASETMSSWVVVWGWVRKHPKPVYHTLSYTPKPPRT